LSKQHPFRSPAQWLAHFAGSIVVGVWWGSLFLGVPLLAVFGLLYDKWVIAWIAYALNVTIVALVVERLAYAGAKNKVFNLGLRSRNDA
jgi:hypothetical protein